MLFFPSRRLFQQCSGFWVVAVYERTARVFLWLAHSGRGAYFSDEAPWPKTWIFIWGLELLSGITAHFWACNSCLLRGTCSSPAIPEALDCISVSRHLLTLITKCLPSGFWGCPGEMLRDGHRYPLWLCFWEHHSSSATRTASGRSCTAINETQGDLSWAPGRHTGAVLLQCEERQTCSGHPASIWRLDLKQCPGGTAGGVRHWSLMTSCEPWIELSLLCYTCNKWSFLTVWAGCWSLAARNLSDQLSMVVKE